MDYLMKLVTTALEWTYQAGETDVRAEWLHSSCYVVIRFGLLMEQDQVSKLLNRSPHGLKSFKTQLRLGGQARAQVVPVYSSGQSSLRSAAPWQPGLQ